MRKIVTLTLLTMLAIVLIPTTTLGEFYATEVEGFNICNCDSNYCDPNPDNCDPDNIYCDPSEAEGPPDEEDPWLGRFVSLGTILNCNRYIEATMEKHFTNGEGPDIRVYEVGDIQSANNEPFDVYISSDGENWIPVASNKMNDPGKSYASIDIHPNSGCFQYIKVVDKSEQAGPTKVPGSDIDAIEAVFECTQSIPTLTEWGLIIFMTVILGIGVMMIICRKRMA